MEIRPFEPELLHIDGRTGRHIGHIFRNFANAPKKSIINMNIESALRSKGQWTNFKALTMVDSRKMIYTNA
jgi:hypothetical protein